MVDEQVRVVGDWTRVEEQLRSWHDASPAGGVMVLLPEAEAHRVPGLQLLAREIGTAMIGALFPALIDGGEFATRGAWLLHWRAMPPFFLVPQDPNDEVASAESICGALSPQLSDDGDSPTLFLTFDAMLPNIASILISVFRACGRAVHYAGVNAGSETFQAMPCLFDKDRFLDRAVLGVLLPSSALVASRHGYPVSNALMHATSTVGNRLDSIDGRPAFDVYQQVIREEYGVELTPANFYEHAVHFPFGVVMTSDVLVRIPVAFGPDGSITCVGEVPTHSRVRLLRAPTLHASDCVRELTLAMNACVGQPLALFYCAGRRMHFGDDAQQELGEFVGATMAPVTYGALTLGEIDTLAGFGLPRFHNASLLSLGLRSAG